MYFNQQNEHGFGPQCFFPILIAAGAALAKGVASKKAGEKAATADIQDQYRAAVLKERAFDPYAPFRRATRGVVWASLMKTWGMDKLFPKEMLEYVGNPRNVPGTDIGGFGGKAYPKGPEETGIPAGKRGGGAWDYIAMGLDVANQGMQAYGAQYGGSSDPFGRYSGTGSGVGGGAWGAGYGNPDEEGWRAGFGG